VNDPRRENGPSLASAPQTSLERARTLRTFALGALASLVIAGCSVSGSAKLGSTGGDGSGGGANSGATGAGAGELGGAGIGGGNANEGGGFLPSTAPPQAGGDMLCVPPSYGTYYVSADDSSSMGSFGLVRELLALGLMPAPSRVRAYEFLNYLNLRTAAAPAIGASPTVSALAHEIEPTPDGKRRFSSLLVAHAPEVARQPLDLTIVVDNSGSMVGEGLARALAGVRSLAGRLESGDTLSVVAYGEASDVLLPRIDVGDAEALLAMLDAEVLPALAPAGGSNLAAALDSAYDELTLLGSSAGRVRRVVLFSDGGANVGVTAAETIADEAATGDAAGVYLAGVGVGPGPGYDDALMNTVTDAGRGAYVYLDSIDEAALLGSRFDELMGVALRDVRFELDLPAGVRLESSTAEQVAQQPQAVATQYLAPADTLAVRVVLVEEVDKSCLAEVQVRLTWEDGGLVTALSARLDEVGTEERAVEGVARLAFELAEALRAGEDIGALASEIEALAAATPEDDLAKPAAQALAHAVAGYAP
jgi:Ca-activated chloride channel family protein